MKIVIDDKIPYIKGAFEGVAEVVYLPGAKTTAEVVKDADAIVTRTRTICNKALLSGSSVKFIATATIGYDHIDTEYCDSHTIKWTNAPGCNSKSVEQYIASALMVIAEKYKWNLAEKCIGVVGVGNVGSKVAKVAEILGMKVLLNDPPRQRTEKSNLFVNLDTILKQADIITLHVPLNLKGDDATFHLANANFFKKLEKNPILINSCRGEVVNTTDVKKAIKSNQIADFVCDCWENEPDLDQELLDLTAIATPHIAGYSKDGKATGTQMSVHAISANFNLGLEDWSPVGIESPLVPEFEINGLDMGCQDIISKAIMHTYDIRKDDQLLRQDTSLFEKIRGDYAVRREFPAYTIHAKNINETVLEKLKLLGFQIKINKEI